MNLHRLRARQDRINRKEFPLKCEEHNKKLSFDKKIKSCKTEIKSLKNKISLEFRQTTITKDVLNEYIFHIISLVFNRNYLPKEREMIEESRQIINLLQKYQDEKSNLLLNDKEMFEDKVMKLMEEEDKREKDLINFGFEKIDFGIKYFNKVKDDFFLNNGNKVDIRGLSDKFEKLKEENRKLNLDFKLIKISYEKMLQMYNKEMKEYLKLKKLTEEIDNKLFTTRLISTGNRYDIFNNSRTKKIKLNIDIKNPTFSTSHTINQEKKCLSHQNLNNKKIINAKLTLNYNTNSNLNKYLKKKKNLTIKTDIDCIRKKSIKRVFSANSLINKNVLNTNEAKKEINLKNVIDYLKQKNIENNKFIKKMGLLISDELKTLIWVKNFISKLINEIRYDIDDIKYYLSNDENNKYLHNELQKNEKLLFFCVYFYDNCIKGNNKTNYFIGYMNNYDKKSEFKKENK